MYFTTFCSSNFSSLDRIIYEAGEMGFEGIFSYTEYQLPSDFRKQHQKMLSPDKRGYGYWIWKPRIILETLNRIPEGAALLYADGGCTLNRQGLPRLHEYASLAEAGKGLLAFFMNTLTIEQWTKPDVIGFFRCHDLKSKPQIMATANIWINSPETREFVMRWADLVVSEDYRLVDDSPSTKVEPAFIEHRHDQSIFSILAYRYGCALLQDETYWQGQWLERKTYPVHATRIRKMQ